MNLIQQGITYLQHNPLVLALFLGGLALLLSLVALAAVLIHIVSTRSVPYYVYMAIEEDGKLTLSNTVYNDASPKMDSLCNKQLEALSQALVKCGLAHLCNGADDWLKLPVGQYAHAKGVVACIEALPNKLTAVQAEVLTEALVKGGVKRVLIVREGEQDKAGLLVVPANVDCPMAHVIDLAKAPVYIMQNEDRLLAEPARPQANFEHLSTSQTSQSSQQSGQGAENILAAGQ